jgi:hypothetical protein
MASGVVRGGIAVLMVLGLAAAVREWAGRLPVPCLDQPPMPVVAEPDLTPRRWLCPPFDPGGEPEECTLPWIVCLPANDDASTANVP